MFSLLDQETISKEIASLRDGLKPKVDRLHLLEGETDSLLATFWDYALDCKAATCLINSTPPLKDTDFLHDQTVCSLCMSVESGYCHFSGRAKVKGFELKGMKAEDLAFVN